MKRMALALSALLLGTGGFGNAQYASTCGTLHKIGANYIVVEVEPLKRVVVKIDPSTLCLEKGKPAKLEDLRAGDRGFALVSAREGTSEAVAMEVRFTHVPVTRRVGFGIESQASLPQV
jgi:hypothetical protein